MLWQRGVGTQGLGVPRLLQQPGGCESHLSHGWAAGRNEPWSCAGPSPGPVAAVSVVAKGPRDTIREWGHLVRGSLLFILGEH